LKNGRTVRNFAIFFAGSKKSDARFFDVRVNQPWYVKIVISIFTPPPAPQWSIKSILAKKFKNYFSQKMLQFNTAHKMNLLR
jgi:small-conductance mechanosensitive channel